MVCVVFNFMYYLKQTQMKSKWLCTGEEQWNTIPSSLRPSSIGGFLLFKTLYLCGTHTEGK